MGRRIALDAQKTTRFKQHPPSLRAQEKMEIRVYGRGHSAPGAMVLRWVLQNCRGVPFKRPISLGGSRIKGPSTNRRVQGGRGEVGKVNLPPYTWLITPMGRRITLDAQETRLVLSNTLRMEIRPAGGAPDAHVFKGSA